MSTDFKQLRKNLNSAPSGPPPTVSLYHWTVVRDLLDELERLERELEELRHLVEI